MNPRMIDANYLIAEFTDRARAARNWKESALNSGNEESAIRADAVLSFLIEVKLTIDNAPTLNDKAYTIGYAAGSREGYKKGNEEAVERIKHLIVLLKSPRVIMPYCKEELQALDLAIKALEEQERPTGEWYYSCQNGWHCSICQQIVKDMPTVMGKANFDYCPNCGAKMKGDKR